MSDKVQEPQQKRSAAGVQGNAQRNPSPSLCSSYTLLMSAAAEGVGDSDVRRDGELRTTLRTGGWQGIVGEDEDGLLGRQLDALSDDVHELPHSQVRRNEVPAREAVGEGHAAPLSYTRPKG